MPLLTRVRVLAAKIETTPGTAESLADADAAMNVFDPLPQPNIPFAERVGQGGFSPLPGTLGAYGGSITFSTEVVGRGVSGGAAPKWAATLLPACGFQNNGDGTFTPVSEAPGSNAKCVTLGCFENGLYKQIRGAMGNAVFNFVSGEVVRVTFTFTGIWDDPSDDTILNAPALTLPDPLRFVSASLTRGSWSPKIASMTLDLGRQVKLREDASDPSGYKTAIITAGRVTGSIDPEAELVANHDTYGLWTDRDEAAVSLVIGSGFNQVDFDLPAVQFVNVQEGDRELLQIDQVDWVANRGTAAGDDDLVIDVN